MVLQTPSTLYFVVQNRPSKVYGYAWRIGTSLTSFYIKARAQPIGAIKISLHGPDSRAHTSKPGFKLAIDQSALPKVLEAGGAFFGLSPGSDIWFEGRRVDRNVRHVMTFRSGSEMFLPGVPSAPYPGEFKAGKQQGLVIPPPEILRSADVDIFVSDGPPYWWNSVEAFRNDSCFGPIQNKAGQYLTGQSLRRTVIGHPVPVPDPESAEDRVRGLVTSIDQRGVLLIQERWMSRSFFARGADSGASCPTETGAALSE